MHWTRRRAVDVSEIDRAISRTVSSLPPTRIDVVLKGLSRAANHGVLWFGVAVLLAARRGTTRKAAMRGVLSIALTSPMANGVLKPLLPRRRPAASELPAYQTIANPPTSSSFPSGHAASAAAFVTAVAMESPRTALAVVPLAGAVVVLARPRRRALDLGRRGRRRRGYGRRARDAALVAGARAGRGARPSVGHRAGAARRQGLSCSCPTSVPAASGYDPAEELEAALPKAVVVRAEPDRALDEQLDEAVERAGDAALAVGVAGGDGSVAAAASVAGRRGLPLVVVPTGTLNHFARDVGVYDLQEAVDATAAGQAVAVDLAMVDVHPGHGDDPKSPAVMRLRCFLNTASLGSYPDLVRLREQWEPRWGKWPAFAAALFVVLRRAEPVRVKLDGRWTKVWFLFVGNGPYAPRGFVPAWRPSLDSGLLDVRWLRADVRFSRLRALLGLISGALGHSRVYGERQVSELDVELAVPGMLATDGEVVEKAGRFTFRVASRPIPVYRRREDEWTGRPRPHQRV